MGAAVNSSLTAGEGSTGFLSGPTGVASEPEEDDRHPATRGTGIGSGLLGTRTVVGSPKEPPTCD